MASNETKERLDCFNNPNWMESALKRCVYFNSLFGNYVCWRCCNFYVCKQLRDEIKKRDKDQLEQVLDTKTATINFKDSDYEEDLRHLYVAPPSVYTNNYLRMAQGSSSSASRWLRYYCSESNDQKGDG